jgi:hypothetical protein
LEPKLGTISNYQTVSEGVFSEVELLISRVLGTSGPRPAPLLVA